MTTVSNYYSVLDMIEYTTTELLRIRDSLRTMSIPHTIPVDLVVVTRKAWVRKDSSSPAVSPPSSPPNPIPDYLKGKNVAIV